MSVKFFIESAVGPPPAKLVLTRKDVQVYLEACGIAWIVLDMQGKSVNVLSVGLFEQVHDTLNYISDAVSSGDIKIVVIASEKRDSFIAGADIDMIYPILDKKEVYKLALQGHDIMNRIESISVPVVAAINGSALGGGLELALCCSHRIALDHPSCVLGLPEIKIGLIPGAGGTIRLPKLIGLQNALQMILTGASIKAKKAESIGLVDGLISDSFSFFILIRRFCIDLMGNPRKPQRNVPIFAKEWMLESNPVGRALIYREAKRNLDLKTRRNYPAPYQALESVFYGWSQDLKDSSLFEAERFAELAVTAECKSLISLFYMMQKSKSIPSQFLIENHIIPSIRNIGIIGAGVMGAQIALLFAKKNYSVYIRDIREDFVSKGLEYIRNSLNDSIKKGKMTKSQVEKITSQISGGTDISGFAGCNLVIEAAVESMELKKKILLEIEDVILDDCIFATNTSSLSIFELSKVSKRPHNIIGMHFFNPVNLMPLVEIVRIQETAVHIINSLYFLSLKIGKVPVICCDGPGFVVNRILGAYLNEAGILAIEGISIELIDKALLEFGMPMGPFRLMDEVGLDVISHVSKSLESALGKRFSHPEGSALLQDIQTDFLGRKTGKGIYVYDSNSLNSQAVGLSPWVSKKLENLKLAKKVVKNTEILDRCILIALQEAAYILDEKLVNSPEELDLAMIMGTGFAPFRGGLLNYADDRGISSIVSRLRELEKIDSKFKPHPLLVHMEKNQLLFFPNRPRSTIRTSKM
jgi:3-hydroxyacyl-CoA dehydrogenase/enoyl-CoA hydratase/3-hydroxybutyryl-CoA epimerase